MLLENKHTKFETSYSIRYVCFVILFTLFLPTSFILLTLNDPLTNPMDIIARWSVIILFSVVLFVTGINLLKKFILDDYGISVRYLIFKKNSWIDYTDIKGYRHQSFRHGAGITLLINNKKKITLSGAVCKNIKELKVELEKRGIKEIK